MLRSNGYVPEKVEQLMKLLSLATTCARPHWYALITIICMMYTQLMSSTLLSLRNERLYLATSKLYSEAMWPRLYWSISNASSWSSRRFAWRELIAASIRENTRSASADDGCRAKTMRATNFQVGSPTWLLHHIRRGQSASIGASAAATIYAGSSSSKLSIVASWPSPGTMVSARTWAAVRPIALACCGQRIHTALNRCSIPNIGVPCVLNLVRKTAQPVQCTPWLEWPGLWLLQHSHLRGLLLLPWCLSNSPPLQLCRALASEHRHPLRIHHLLPVDKFSWQWVSWRQWRWQVVVEFAL